MTPTDAKRAIREAFDTALAAIEPRSVVTRFLSDHSEELGDGPVGLVAIGKAAAGMAWGAQDALGDRLVSGVAVGPEPSDAPEGISWFTGGHPVPDSNSETAGRAVIDYLDSADVEFVVFLISGGGSALAEVPPEGVGIDELAMIQQTLLRSGIPIDQVNLARRSLSLLKNGHLLDHTSVPHATLLISDVGDAPAEVIASGPTIGAPTSAGTVTAILERAGLEIGGSLRAHLDGLGPITANENWTVVADSWSAVQAAEVALEGTGLPISVPRRPFSGEARRVAPALVRGAGSGFTVAPGEATVTVTGDGVGGRNTEAALTVAINIDGTDDVVFAALTTDGVDGPTDVAGAIVDGGSASRMRAAGISPEAALMDNDSYRALAASGDVVRTGPTGTNVADLWFVWRP